jgi:mutator protein MutT
VIQVVAAIIKKNGKYLIAKRAKHKMHPGKWEFPGGKIEANETPEEALERELFEEFGIISKTGGHVITSIHDYGSIKIKLLAYESIHIKGDFHLSDHDEIAWVKAIEMTEYSFAEADLPVVDQLILNDTE